MYVIIELDTMFDCSESLKLLENQVHDVNLSLIYGILVSTIVLLGKSISPS